MPVLERADLEASPLADLHAIADEIGLDGFRRLRKADLIDRILGQSPAGGSGASEAIEQEYEGEEDDVEADEPERATSTRARARSRTRRSSTRSATADQRSASRPASGSGRRERSRVGQRSGAREREDGSAIAGPEVEGTVELLENGSAFLRLAGDGHSGEDVYISAAQVRRCELVNGDRVSGPVRAPRRSERHPSLVRVEEINGEPADRVSEVARYDDLPVAYPSERITFASRDATLEAIEWLTPLGRGSRAVIVGPARAGKTHTLRRVLEAMSAREDQSEVDQQTTLVLLGARPEEIAWWQEGPVAPAAALTFAASADAQSQALERALDEAKRVAARGADAVVLIDGLDGVQPQSARKALAAARNLREAGSLTLIATASKPFGGESTVIALDAALASTGREPILDLLASGTLRAELLVGEDGARAIAQARASALE
jgi:transcription termination factor Rho